MYRCAPTARTREQPAQAKTRIYAKTLPWQGRAPRAGPPRSNCVPAYLRTCVPSYLRTCAPSDSVLFESSTLLGSDTVYRCRTALEQIVSTGFDEKVLQFLRLRTISNVSNAIRSILPVGYAFPEPLMSGVLDATRASADKPKFSLHVHTRLGIFQRCVIDLWNAASVPDADMETPVLFSLAWAWEKVPKHWMI
jgi:hypothetical protein